MNVQFNDNSQEVLAEFREAVIRALEKCGLTGEGIAKVLCAVDTGELRNSITHIVVIDENTVYIGTDNDHGIYVELGTGKYYPGGRPTPWVYQDAKGNWHMTHGQRAQPYLKPAVADHAQTYKKIIEDEMHGR